MDMMQLKYFQTAAKYESITQAAEELFIPQPTVSKQIKSLEAELGYQLFTRPGKHIHLNENGKIFLRYVREINFLLEDCKKELLDFNQNKETDVALLVTSCSKILPDILHSFKKIHPEIRLFINQNNTSHGEADLSLFSRNSILNTEGCIHLLSEEICLAVPKSHPFSDKKTISVKELAEEPFIMLNEESNLNAIVGPYFEQHGFRPNTIMQLENPSILRKLISTEFGISVMPSVTWGEPERMGITLIPFAEGGLNRHIHLAWNQNRYVTRSTRELREYIKNYFDALVAGSFS